jgi:hypothetical protein
MWAVQFKKKQNLRAGYGGKWLQKYMKMVPPEYKKNTDIGQKLNIHKTNLTTT